MSHCHHPFNTQMLKSVRAVVYRATVTESADGKVETYTGVTGGTFKKRWDGHKTTFEHEKNRNKTTLANHIWQLKNEKKKYEIKWGIIDRGKIFNPTTRKCRVCLKEKKHILYNQIGSSLNRRTEIFNTCMHRTQKLLEKVEV